LPRFSSLALILFCSVAGAQEPLTLDQAVARAIDKYAGVRVSAEQASAAAYQIQLARTAFLPQADFISQLNRATRNNVFGMLLPQSVIAPISGPPLAENSMTNVFGSATGILVSWEPFDFGLRQARVDAAAAGERSARAAVARTKFEVAHATADAFLTVLAAEQTIRTASANLKRAGALEQVVAAQVKAELRPGADLARIRAEIAVAEAQLIQGEQAVGMAQANLSQFVMDASLKVAPGRLLEAPAGSVLAQADTALHPLVQEQAAAMGEQTARQKILDKSYYPRFNVQGTTYARGTGANPDFTTGGALAGFGPNIVNWGTGITMTFPVGALPGLRAQRQLEAARTRAEAQRQEQIKQDLAAQQARALAQFQGARRVAAKIPPQLEAARQAETQSTARYQAGLGGITEVVEAQRLVAQAEIEQSLANLAIWRAMLAVSAAQGDLEPFLKAAAAR
jgi:outer membrane protein